MKFFVPIFCFILITSSALIAPAKGQIGKTHHSVESLVASADFVAIGRLENVRREESPTKNGTARYFVQPFFSEILKGQGNQDKLDELESFFAASDFHQKLVADKTSGVWFVNFSEDGKVSFNPPGWSFWAFEELDGFRHSLFAPPMLSNDLSVLTTQDAILTKLRQSCEKPVKKNNDGTPTIVNIDVPRWLVGPVGAADANRIYFVVDDVCEKTAKLLVTNPIQFLRMRNLENDDFKVCQLESLGLELLQHFPSKENEQLVRNLLKAPVHRSATQPRRISAYEILLKWGTIVERPSFWETITELDLPNSNANDDTMALLGKLDNLEQLNLKDTQVTKAGLSLLRPLRNLSLLELDSQQVTDDNLKALDEIGLLETISVVGWKYVDGAEVRSGATTEINSLSLANCQLTDIGFSEFSHLENVDWVDLSATLVSDEGLDSLSRMSQLKTLHIGDTGITDLGVKKISQFKKLEGLTLTNLNISDQALTFLTDLSRLRHINLEGTNVTPEAGATLQKALPDCKIRLPNVNSKQ